MTITELPCDRPTDVTPASIQPASVRPALPAAPAAPLLPVVGADLRAPLADGGDTRYVNLDYAASAPALRAVADHVAEILPTYASVHRGAGYASQLSTRRYEDARASVARFVGARADDVVVFTRNTTDSLNLLAGCVPAGGEVVVLDIEHHANLLPWQRRAHRVVPAAATLAGTLSRLQIELARRPAALLAVTGASNVTGELLPLGALAGLAHRHGARIAVDAAQLAPHRRIDVVAGELDYVAFSGHKLYAPFGAGVLVGRRDWLDAAPPYLAGGGAVREVTVTGTEWGPAPARHEGGSPNVIGAAALAHACAAIEALPDGCVEEHESALRRRLLAGLHGIAGVRELRLWPDGGAAIGVVAFTVDGWAARQVAEYLSAEHGIGVRDGRFCAHPLLTRLGAAGGAVRASFGLGSTAADVDRLLAAVRRLVREGTPHHYAVTGDRPCDDETP